MGREDDLDQRGFSQSLRHGAACVRGLGGSQKVEVDRVYRIKFPALDIPEWRGTYGLKEEARVD